MASIKPDLLSRVDVVGLLAKSVSAVRVHVWLRVLHLGVGGLVAQVRTFLVLLLSAAEALKKTAGVQRSVLVPCESSEGFCGCLVGSSHRISRCTLQHLSPTPGFSPLGVSGKATCTRFPFSQQRLILSSLRHDMLIS